jgi:hypothetical protein
MALSACATTACDDETRIRLTRGIRANHLPSIDLAVLHGVDGQL